MTASCSTSRARPTRPKRNRRRPRPRRPLGTRRPRHGTASEAIGHRHRRHRPRRPRPPPSRGAICCFPRRRDGNASAPRRQPHAKAGEPPATFEEAWPQPERARPPEAPIRRSGRPPSTVAEANAGPAADRAPPAVRNEDPPAVTMLKSGVVDGMAYSLYSDGSIEAQMPEGMMRFASIDELRALSRSARLSRQLYFGRNSPAKIKHRCSCQLGSNSLIFGK